MGNFCCSINETRQNNVIESDELKVTSGHCVFEFVCLNGVPRADMMSESDPYIKADLLMDIADNTNSKKSAKSITNGIGSSLKSMYRHDNKNPIFHCYHNFYCEPPPTAILCVEIFDYDTSRLSTLLGWRNIPISDFTDEDLKTYTLLCSGHGSHENNIEFTLTIRRIFINKKPPFRKTFFMIRHGESKWNKAQNDKDLKGMGKDTETGKYYKGGYLGLSLK